MKTVYPPTNTVCGGYKKLQNKDHTKISKSTVCVLASSEISRFQLVFAYPKNKDADQLRGDREAVQRLCFRYIDTTIPLLPN